MMTILDGRDSNFFFHFLRAMDVLQLMFFTKTWKCSTNVWKRNFKVTLFRHISLEDILINWIEVRITIDARCFLLFFIRHKCVFAETCLQAQRQLAQNFPDTYRDCTYVWKWSVAENLMHNVSTESWIIIRFANCLEVCVYVLRRNVWFIQRGYVHVAIETASCFNLF